MYIHVKLFKSCIKKHLPSRSPKITTNHDIAAAMQVRLEDIFPELPEKKVFAENIRRAPKRELILSREDIKLALKNALRYVPEAWHAELAPEFLDELLTKGPYLRLSFPARRPTQGSAH